MKKISIIVPVYKVEKYLDRCIESIVSQKYKNFEIVLVDDGSPDACPAMCDEWAKKDARIKVVHKKNGGVSSARNMALDLASGDYVTFVDSDDYVLDAFSDLCEMLKNQDLLFVCSEKASKKRHALEKVSKQGKNKIIDYLISNSRDLSTNSVWNKIYKRSAIANVRFNPQVSVMEDLDFVLRVLQACQNVEFAFKDYYVYFQREDSVMHEFSYAGINKVVVSGKNLVEEYKDSNLAENYKKKYVSLISENMYGVFGRYKNMSGEDRVAARQLIKDNIKLFGYTKKFIQKAFYVFMRVFGVRFALWVYCIL